MRYKHTQRAPLNLILTAFGVASFVAASSMPDWFTQLILLLSAGFLFLLALSFGRLTVSDEGDQLLVRFGPLPLFSRRIYYDDIQEVQQSRSTLMDGWGIHVGLRGGWTWNLWGFDCVELKLTGGRVLRIGTDDDAGLAQFLNRQLKRVGQTFLSADNDWASSANSE